MFVCVYKSDNTNGWIYEHVTCTCLWYCKKPEMKKYKEITVVNLPTMRDKNHYMIMIWFENENL